MKRKVKFSATGHKTKKSNKHGKFDREDRNDKTEFLFGRNGKRKNIKRAYCKAKRPTETPEGQRKKTGDMTRTKNNKVEIGVHFLNTGGGKEGFNRH